MIEWRQTDVWVGTNGWLVGVKQMVGWKQTNDCMAITDGWMGTNGQLDVDKRTLRQRQMNGWMGAKGFLDGNKRTVRWGQMDGWMGTNGWLDGDKQMAE